MSRHRVNVQSCTSSLKLRLVGLSSCRLLYRSPPNTPSSSCTYHDPPSMRLVQVIRIFILVIASFALLARALEEVPPAPLEAMPSDPEQPGGAGNKPKLMRPRKGFHKSDEEVDIGDQRARADQEILENAEELQPEGERVLTSLDDLR